MSIEKIVHFFVLESKIDFTSSEEKKLSREIMYKNMTSKERTDKKKKKKKKKLL